MKIRVVSIGKTNLAYVEEGLKTYVDRLQHYVRLSWEEIQDVKKIDRSNQHLLKQKEGEKLMQQIKPTDTVYLLDDKGKSYTSEDFAHWIEQHQLYQQSDLVLIIGGAFGFSDEIKKRAQGKISLSKMTFNHQMVRLVLIEQVYRAYTIMKGEPYHHA